MKIPESVRIAVTRNDNERAVAEQAQRRWCEALASARFTWKRRIKSERERFALDLMAIELAHSGKFSPEQARSHADLAHRLGTPTECALWARVHTKITNLRRNG